MTGDPTGRFVWVINRLDHTVSMFTIDPNNGYLTPQAKVATEETLSTGEIARVSERGQNAEAIALNGSAVNDVIVRVNGQIIDRGEYERAEQQLIDVAQRDNAMPAELEQRKKDLLRDMIDQQLLIFGARNWRSTPTRR